MTSCRAVLTNDDLLHSIVAFQEGLHGKYHGLHRQLKYIKTDTTRPSRKTLETLTPCLGSWLERYGASSLPDLIQALPYVERVAGIVAAFTGNLEIFLELPGLASRLCGVDVLDIAAERGHADVAAFLHTHGHRCTRRVRLASVFQHLDVARFLVGGGGNRWLDATEAIRSGCSLEIVQLLHTVDAAEFSAESMDVAAARGQLEIVRFLHFNRSEGCTINAVDDAACQGHADVVEFLLLHRTDGGSQRGLHGAILRRNLAAADEILRRSNVTCQPMFAASVDTLLGGHRPTIEFVHNCIVPRYSDLERREYEMFGGQARPCVA